jgi:hypothetical protein
VEAQNMETALFPILLIRTPSGKEFFQRFLTTKNPELSDDPSGPGLFIKMRIAP